MSELIVPLIMCGGAGTRLWPASREGRPKQFLPLVGSPLNVSGDRAARRRSGFVRTPGRHHQRRLPLSGRGAAAQSGSRRISCSSRHAAIPARRSPPALHSRACATAIRSSSRWLPIMWSPMLPAFRGRVSKRARGSRRRAKSSLSACGRPAGERYGYIRPGATIGNDIFAVEKFVEKPDEATAREYVAERLSVELRQFHVPRRNDPRRVPSIRAGTALPPSRQRSTGPARTSDSSRSQLEAFAQRDGKSIDYAVMEKTSRAAVLRSTMDGRMSARGSRVGASSQRAERNATQGKAVSLNANGSYVAIRQGGGRAAWREQPGRRGERGCRAGRPTRAAPAR